ARGRGGDGPTGEARLIQGSLPAPTKRRAQFLYSASGPGSIRMRRVQKEYPDPQPMKGGAGIRVHLPPRNQRSINATCGSQIGDKDPIAPGEFHRKARPTAGSIARGGNTGASTRLGSSLHAP